MKNLTTASDRKRSRLKKFQWRGNAAARFLASLAVAGMAAAGAAYAAPATWTGSGLDSNWGTSGNWNPGVPGAVGTTNNTDTATFTGVVANTIATLDQSYNLQNITFSGATASAYTINASGSNALLLTSGGAISSSAANVETVNAPLVIEPASATTAGTYTFSSSATLAANVLNMTGPITLGSTTAADTLNLGGTNTGANTVSGTISQSAATAAGGLNLNKTGTGSWTFGGSGTSTLAKGSINVSAGTFNFGSVTDTPTLNITTFATPNTTVSLTGASTFNMTNGTLQANSGIYGLVLDGTSIYNQTGGTFTTNGVINALANSTGSNDTLNLSGGTLTTTGRFELAVRGTGTFNLSGSGALTTTQLVMNTTQLGSGTANGTFNLNGGTLTTGSIINGTGGPTGPGNTFNFNGGLLTASASTTTFMQGLTVSNVLAGGANINTGAFNDTINQNLLASTTSTGGGLTKTGAGALTLTGASTYTGATTISAGTLQLGDGISSATDGTINSSSGITDNASLIFDRFGSVSSAVPISGTGTVTKTGAGTQTLTGANTYTGNTTVSAGTLTVGNGTTGSITSGTGVLSIGNVAGNSVLNINSGSLANTASLTFIGNASGAASALNLTSGTFTSTLADGDGNGGVVGQAGYGALNVSGGTLTLPRIYVGSGNGATGVVNISGGSVTVNGGFDLIINRGSNAVTDVATVSGGTLNTTASGIYVGFQGTGGAQLNVTGGTINNSGRTLNYGSGGSFSGTGIVNLDAGTFQTDSIAKNSGTGLLNFNGGTLKGGTNGSTTFIPSSVTAAYVNGAFGTFAGGAVIDTNSRNETVVAPLLAPTGNGVTSVAVTGGTGYVGAPYVAITGGGGTGATAIANIDANGNLTGITITNPGVGYASTPTVTLTGGGGTGAAIGTVSTAANTSGGLTKQGTGTLTLSGANTYTGATQVTGGTLAVNGSTAAASNVTVASAGTLTGTGIVGGSVADSGTLNAGGVGTVGTLTTGADTFNPASSLVFDFGNNTVDEIFSTGLVSGLSNAAFSFTQLAGSTGLVNPSYTLIAAGGGFSDMTLPTSVTGTPSGYQLQFSGNNLNLVQIAAAPEPNQAAVFGIGLLGLGALGLKARRRPA